jgi:hypothetical protein
MADPMDLERIKALLDQNKPQPVSADLPPPQLPQGPDPALIKSTLQRANMLGLVHGALGVHTPSTYEVMKSGSAQPQMMPSPAYDAARSNIMAPLQEEQARVGLANQQGEVKNKYDVEKTKFGLEAGKTNAAIPLAELKGMLNAWGTLQKGQTAETVGAGHDKAKLEATRMQMGGAGGGLTPEALDQAATLWHKTGTLPPMGMGTSGAVTRRQIINRSAQLFPSDDVASNKANYGADTGSQKNLQKISDQTDAFEATALKNLDNFIATAKTVSDTGSPALNKPARWLDENMGDPNIAAFRTARQVAVTEIAKVLNASNSQISDSARHEVSGLIGPDATGDQIAAAAKILKSDMENRRAGNKAQLGTIQGRISGKPAQEAPKVDPVALEQKARTRLAKDPKDAWGLQVLQALGKQ